MNTLLLRLAGPLQSWGISSKFDRRITERAPSKSAIIGMIAAALGLGRNDEQIEELSKSLVFGVRIDREGTLLRDFHTAKSRRSAYVTHRYYLSDAVFLVGFQGDIQLLRAIEIAMLSPYYPLFLGRRSCSPEGRIVLGLRNLPLYEALANEPILSTDKRNKQKKFLQLRVLIEVQDETAESYLVNDNPVSFSQQHRQFTFRRVQESIVNINIDPIKVEADFETVHDPLAELEDKQCI